MKSVFIFLYGAELKPFMQLKPKKDEPIICADSGIVLVEKLKYKPREIILIGDLDSVSRKSLDWCRKNKVKIIKHPENKNFTDGHLALEYAFNKYPSFEKIVIGGISDKLDHTLGNILPVLNLISNGDKLKFVNDKNIIYLCYNSIEINNCKGHTISLIPLKKSHIRKTSGLKWKIENEIIDFYQSKTLRNIAVSDKVKIEEDGVLMVIETW